jgi:glycosyltransferase involved in cell wall biosynthesis
MPLWLKMLFRVIIGRGPIVVLGPAERAWFTAALTDANVFVLPNCVAAEDAWSFERCPRSEGYLTILYLGRISLDKGIDIVYDAVRVLKDAGSRIRLVIAGTGPDEHIYVEKFRKLLGDNFTFSGVVRGPAKTHVMKESDVFLLPSKFEGLPMALLECMAFGLVPVTTGVGSIPSVVVDGKNGLLLRENTAAEVVQAVERLLADRQSLHRLGAAARATALSADRATTYLKHLNEIYEYGNCAGIPRRH